MLLLVAVHLPEDPAEEDRVPEETFDVKTELQKLIDKYKIISILLLKAKGTIMKPNNKELEKPKTPIQLPNTYVVRTLRSRLEICSTGAVSWRVASLRTCRRSSPSHSRQHTQTETSSRASCHVPG